jgi:hypothetical protein
VHHFLAVLVVMWGISPAAAQTPPAPQQPPPPSPLEQQLPPSTPQPAGVQTPPVPAPAVAVPVPTGRVFGAEAGLILNAIKPERTADFETVMARLKEALLQSSDPVRRQQAAGWKVFKATEPGPNATVLYVFAMDPAVKGADYTVGKILAEAFPDDVEELYKQYISSYATGQTLLNLELLQDFSDPTALPKPTAVPPKK